MPSKKGNSKNSKPDDASTTNKPRNHVVQDATSQFTFTFKQFGSQKSISVDQTADEDTWPGGALWDIGVLLAKVLVMVNTPPPSSSSASSGGNKKQELYVPRLRTPGIWPTSWKDCTILELGCGVGLTGLVGAALGAKLTLLTDLDVVVEKVTKKNVELNKGRFVGMGQKVLAVPLSWGNENDEMACRKLLQDVKKLSSSSSNNTSRRKVKKGNKGKAKAGNPSSQKDSTLTVPTNAIATATTDPSIILIGDVAYQHKPGAPSHFDILISTLLKFATTPSTVVVFGTRMRMPASADLLDMFREHFEEIIEPVGAHEIDRSFDNNALGRSSLITIHVFKRKN